MDVCAICRDYVVAAVRRGIEDRFVFTHKSEGYAAGEAAKCAFITGNVDMVPCAGVGEARLSTLLVKNRNERYELACASCMMIATQADCGDAEVRRETHLAYDLGHR